jgi:hypothetical protein
LDIEKSRQFYQNRYFKAIRQFGSKSLTASICKKKLEMLDESIKQRSTSGNLTAGTHTTEAVTTSSDDDQLTDNRIPKEKLPTD